jgi:hypothetical protein
MSKVFSEAVLEGKALRPSQVFEPDEPSATPDVELEEIVAQASPEPPAQPAAGPSEEAATSG